MDTVMESCKLCLKESVLQDSHAIGDSVFKRIFRNNSGKAISLSHGSADIGYCSDSWSEPQLCIECERLLNHEYETYSLGVLRGQGGKFSKTPYGVTFSGVDQQRLIMYFLSIVWRVANSDHPSYKNVRLLDADNEFLRLAILSNKKIPPHKYSVQVSRVIDKTSRGDGFSLETLKNIIVSPFNRVYGGEAAKNISVCLMFEGFFIEVFTRGLGWKAGVRKGILSKNKNILFVPHLDLFKIDEIVDLLVVGYGKQVEGRSRVE